MFHNLKIIHDKLQLKKNVRTGLIVQVKSVFCVNGCLKVVWWSCFKLAIAKIAPICSITKDCGTPKIDAPIIKAPLTKEMIDAVNKPKGTISSAAVFKGPEKMNAPTPYTRANNISSGFKRAVLSNAISGPTTLGTLFVPTAKALKQQVIITNFLSFVWWLMNRW